MGWLTSLHTSLVQFFGLPQFFQNPFFVVPGAALISSPIIIHLINRMRYRRVRFAAMEFLFESEQQNRRRVLLEQLLLLLLRILLVLLIMMLLARLILEPKKASLFRGSKTHHVVLLDDSASMRERWEETSAFEEAKNVIQTMVEEGAKRPGQQVFTLILLSDFENHVFEKRDINEEFVEEVKAKLTSLSCTHQDLSMVDALGALEQRLSEERGVLQNLHIVSDFRAVDWIQQRALPEKLQQMEQGDININLVSTVPKKTDNLAITHLTGELHVATAGVPLKLSTNVANYGQQAVENVEVEVLVDGKPVSISQGNSTQEKILFQSIEPLRETETEDDDEAQRKEDAIDFLVTINTPGWHNIQLQIPDDSLIEDNVRYLTVYVKEQTQVLLIDGDRQAEDSFYISKALSSIPELRTVIRDIDALRKLDLSQYSSIYMLNVSDLPADALKPLKAFVQNGGGLVWYVGRAVKASYYNQSLYDNGRDGLFPVPLLDTAAELTRPNEPGAKDPGADLKFSEHPIFVLFLGDDNPFPSTIQVGTYIPAAQKWEQKTKEGIVRREWNPDDSARKDGVTTIAWLRNGDPVAFDHQYGEGRVITFLTTAGTSWNNWAKTPPVYVITQQEMQKHIARRLKDDSRRVSGDPIVEVFSETQFFEEVKLLVPLRKQPQDLNAVPVESSGEDEEESQEVSDLEVAYTKTDTPGIYTMTLQPKGEGVLVQKRWAVNVPSSQSDLSLAELAAIKNMFPEGSSIRVQESGDFSWLEGQDNDQLARYLLVAFLILFLVFEQLMAYRLSYHTTPKVKTRPAPTSSMA